MSTLPIPQWSHSCAYFPPHTPPREAPWIPAGLPVLALILVMWHPSILPISAICTMCCGVSTVSPGPATDCRTQGPERRIHQASLPFLVGRGCQGVLTSSELSSVCLFLRAPSLALTCLFPRGGHRCSTYLFWVLFVL